MIFPQNPNVFIGLAISLLFSLLIFNGFYFLVSLYNFRKSEKIKYSFLNMFPYELFRFKKESINHIHFISFIILELSYFLTAIYFVNQFVIVNFNNLILVVIGISLFINVLLNLLINIISPNRVKAHLSVVTLYMLNVFLCSSLLAVFFYTNIFIGELPYLVFAIIFTFISLIQIVIILNPNLSNWAKLENVKNEDGTTSLIRPKLFVLSFSEWLTYFLFNLMIIVLLITMFVL